LEKEWSPGGLWGFSKFASWEGRTIFKRLSKKLQLKKSPEALADATSTGNSGPFPSSLHRPQKEKNEKIRGGGNTNFKLGICGLQVGRKREKASAPPWTKKKLNPELLG